MIWLTILAGSLALLCLWRAVVWRGRAKSAARGALAYQAAAMEWEWRAGMWRKMAVALMVALLWVVWRVRKMAR